MKATKSSTIAPVLVGRHPVDARGRALADVAEQARSADLRRPLEHPRRARAHREHPQQQVDGLADRPGVAVGPEVLDPLALRPAPDHDPRELLAHGDREPRVGLVVAVLDVEAGVVLLDPGVLQLQRLDLGRHDRPVDPGRAGDHLLGARVQVGEVLEVRRQPRSQATWPCPRRRRGRTRRGTGRPRARPGSPPAPVGTSRDRPPRQPTARLPRGSSGRRVVGAAAGPEDPGGDGSWRPAGVRAGSVRGRP